MSVYECYCRFWELLDEPLGESPVFALKHHYYRLECFWRYLTSTTMLNETFNIQCGETFGIINGCRLGTTLKEPVRMLSIFYYFYIHLFYK